MRRLLTLPLTALLVVALAGCVPTKAVDVAPSPTATVAFASDEEAYILSVEAYSNLVLIGDEIGQDGGRNPARLAKVATGSFLDDTVAGYERWEASGLMQLGNTSFRDFEVWKVGLGPKEAVVAVVCDDVTPTDLVDAAGLSQLDPNLPDTFYSVVVFDLDPDGALKVSRRFLWDDRAC